MHLPLSNLPHPRRAAAPNDSHNKGINPLNPILPPPPLSPKRVVPRCAVWGAATSFPGDVRVGNVAASQGSEGSCLGRSRLPCPDSPEAQIKGGRGFRSYLAATVERYLNCPFHSQNQTDEARVGSSMIFTSVAQEWDGFKSQPARQGPPRTSPGTGMGTMSPRMLFRNTGTSVWCVYACGRHGHLAVVPGRAEV